MADKTNYTSNITVTGTADNDYIYNGNSGSNVIINSGNGDDKIYNYGNESTINSGNGNDVIYIGKTVEDATITTGNGQDTITIDYNTNYSYYTGGYLNGAQRTDITITDLTTDDVVHFYAPINSNDVDAYIQNGNLEITKDDYETYGLTGIIIPGITTTKKLEEIKKVKVNNGGTMTTLGNLIDSANVKIILDSNVIFNGNSKDERIYSYGKNNIVYGYGGDDQIEFSNNTTVYGGSGKDWIGLSGGDNALIYGEDGNDNIDVYGIKNVTVSGGSGNDGIAVEYDSSFVSVNGDAGNDYFLIDTTANKVTITGGSGKDTIAFSYWDVGIFTEDKMAEAVITDLKPKEDVLRIGREIKSLTAYKENNNLILRDKENTLSITLPSVAITDEIKDVVVENNGLSGDNSKITITTVGALLTNKIIAPSEEEPQKEKLDISKIAGELVGKGYKVYSFISKFKDYFKETKLANLTTTLSELLQITLNVVNGTQKLNGELVKTITSKIGDLTKFINTLSTKNPIPVMLIVAVTVHIKNTLDTLNDHELTEKEKKSLNLSFMNVTFSKQRTEKIKEKTN